MTTTCQGGCGKVRSVLYADSPADWLCFGCRQRRARLEYLRGQLRAECISWGELAELQGLAPFIPADDLELRQAAGIEEGQ